MSKTKKTKKIAKMKVRKGDHVVVVAGRDKGKKGDVLDVRRAKQRVVVQGVNMVKRHQRPTSSKEAQKGAQTGGIIDKEGPIHVSNVMLLDPQDNQPTRVGMRDVEGKRARFARRTNNPID